VATLIHIYETLAGETRNFWLSRPAVNQRSKTPSPLWAHSGSRGVDGVVEKRDRHTLNKQWSES